VDANVTANVIRALIHCSGMVGLPIAHPTRWRSRRVGTVGLSAWGGKKPEQRDAAQPRMVSTISSTLSAMITTATAVATAVVER